MRLPVPFRSRLARSALSAVLCAIAIALATPDPGLAQSREFKPPEDEALRLSMKDALFDQLKAAGSEAEGDAIADKIWWIWMVGPNDEATEMMRKAMARRDLYDFAGAHEILDVIAEGYPQWSEVWNQRAYVRFLQERYDPSLEDIDRALELEPRHFGALAGRALVLMRQGRFQLGQKALRETLEVHPWAKERAMLVPLPTDPPTDPAQPEKKI